MSENVEQIVDKIHRRSTEFLEIKELGLRKFGNETNPGKLNDRGWTADSTSEISGPNQEIWFPPMKQKIHVPTRGKKEKRKVQQKAKKKSQKKINRKRKRIPIKKSIDKTNRSLF